MLGTECKSTCEFGFECQHKYPLGSCLLKAPQLLGLLATINLFLIKCITFLPVLWLPNLFESLSLWGTWLVVYFSWQVGIHQPRKWEIEKHMNCWWLEILHSLKFCWSSDSLFRGSATRCCKLWVTALSLHLDGCLPGDCCSSKKFLLTQELIWNKSVLRLNQNIDWGVRWV